MHGTMNIKFILLRHRQLRLRILPKFKNIPFHARKAYWERRGLAPLTLWLKARWRWVCNIMSLPLYRQ